MLTTKPGKWVLCWRVKPPSGITLMVRSGGSVFFAAVSEWSGWKMLVPGHGEEKIAQPDEWFITQEMERELGAQVPVEAEEVPPSRTRKGQYLLELGDSISQSRRDA